MLMANTNKGGKFRRKIGFSAVSNAVAMDSNLSLKAKGLYLLIQTYITIPGFTLYKNYLMSQCKERESAFDSAWNELKRNGYLKQYKMQDTETKRFCYEYELLDEPMKETNAHCEPHPENQGVGKPDPDFPDPAFPDLGNPPPGFSRPGKLGVYNQTIQNQTIPSHTIHNHITSGERTSVALVKKQISYDDLLATSMIDCDLLDEIVSLIAEVYDMIGDDTIRVQKRRIKAKYVRQQFAKLESKHIAYIAEKIASCTSDVRNPKAYMLTMLYNVPSTMEMEMQFRVAYDLNN